MKKYSLNSDFVLRFDERIIFDPDQFIVHKFNRTGMDVVKVLESKSLTFNEIIDNFSKEFENELKSFINKAIQVNVIVRC